MFVERGRGIKDRLMSLLERLGHLYGGILRQGRWIGAGKRDHKFCWDMLRCPSDVPVETSGVDLKSSESKALNGVQVLRHKLEHDQLIKKHETGYDSLGRQWRETDRSRVQNRTHLPEALFFGHFPAPLIKDL